MPPDGRIATLLDKAAIREPYIEGEKAGAEFSTVGGSPCILDDPTIRFGHK